MIYNHYTLAALARERRKALVAAAETAHRAKQARLGRPQGRASVARRSAFHWTPNWLRRGAGRLLGHRPRWTASGRQVTLRDGSQVLIRRIQSTDAPLLADGFTRLSADSRRTRFLTAKKELSAAELRYLTEVDHHDHEALGALNHADGRGVGIARYIRDAENPRTAEIAVTVVDDWQRRGLGTELLTQLSDRARQEGIRRFTALVATDNVAVAALLRNMSADLVRRQSSTLEYEITLAPGEQHDHARRVPLSG
jgi:RimJ/RimL family protein N-acetyltransferase